MISTYTKLINIHNYVYFCNLKIYIRKNIRMIIGRIYIRYSYSFQIWLTNIFNIHIRSILEKQIYSYSYSVNIGKQIYSYSYSVLKMIFVTLCGHCPRKFLWNAEISGTTQYIWSLYAGEIGNYFGITDFWIKMCL